MCAVASTAMGKAVIVSVEEQRELGAGEALRGETDVRRKRGSERRFKKGLYKNRVKQCTVG